MKASDAAQCYRAIPIAARVGLRETARVQIPRCALLLALTGLCLRGAVATEPGVVTSDAAPAFAAKLQAATTRHLDELLAEPAKLTALKGKSAAGMTALAFELAFEATRKTEYHGAALKIADAILAELRATKFGVLYIKEKTRSTGEDISGGGPPAFGWYTSALAYIYRREPNRDDALRYLAGIIDRYPWNEQGWWAATIDVRTGEPKQPLSKPSPINKNAAMVSAAGITAVSMRRLEPELAARLAAKAARCIEQQLVPAQEADGFWHYGLTGNDPKEKDVWGYFMLTICELIQWREMGAPPEDTSLRRALEKAGGFAHTVIVPATDPNKGQSTNRRRTAGTPAHYAVAEDPRRGFQLALSLIGTGHVAEGIAVGEEALRHFPFGDRGQDAGQAVHACALMGRLLRAPSGSNADER